MTSVEDFDGPLGRSEFDEAYDTGDVSGAHQRETFTAELLLETLEVLNPPVPICVQPDETVGKVIAGMAARNHGCALVTENGILVGIFTERDAIRRVVGKVDPDRTPIRAVMTREPEAVTFHDTIAVVLNKMGVGGFRHVPLVDIQMRPVGVLSVKDLVMFFVRNFPQHVLNVSPNPTLREPDRNAGAG